MAQQFGLIAVLDNKELDAREQAAIKERRLVTGEDAPPADPYAGLVQRLAAYIEACWQAAKGAKESSIESQMLAAVRQREGEYDPEKLAAIREQGGSEVFAMITNAKCRAAEGWLRDILLPQDDTRPFATRPSPVPDDLPNEVKQGIVERVMGDLQEALQAGLYVTPEQVYERSRQMYDKIRQRFVEEAKARAERMEDEIDDKFVEGGWYEALDSMIPDLVTYPAAFLKGPVVRKKARIVWKPDPKTGKSVPQAADELVPVYYSPSPMDIYPAPDSREINDGYLFERINLRRSALHRMIGVPGYKEEAIRAALDEYQRAGHDINSAAEKQRRELENSPQWQMTPDHSIDSLEFHGQVRGEWLLEWGMPKAQVPDKDADYEVTALKVGRFIVRCVLNEDPLRRRPYDKCSYDEIKGQFWGRGLPPLIKDCQDVCNATMRSIVNNVGMSSGPITEVEVDRLAEGEDVTTLYPWKIIQTKASKTTPGAAVRFYTPPTVTQQLMQVFSAFSALADNYSGVPQYAQGINPTRGAAATASGMSMLQGNQLRLMKGVLKGVDRCIRGSAQRTHTFIMLHEASNDANGDANIVARGSSSLVAKEQIQLRRAQFVQSTANPFDMQILGPIGRAELLRDTMRMLDYNVDEIMPTRDEMQAQQMQQALSLQAQMAGGQGAGGMPAMPPAQDAAGNVRGGAERALFAA